MEADTALTSSATLIEASRVNGSTVYNPQAEKLGTIDDLMVDKRSGAVVYAIMSFGGFLGIGNDYYPIPWKKLTYNSDVGGYVVDIDAKALVGAPVYKPGEEPLWGDKVYEEGIHNHYGIAPYWGSSWI